MTNCNPGLFEKQITRAKKYNSVKTETSQLQSF